MYQRMSIRQLLITVNEASVASGVVPAVALLSTVILESGKSILAIRALETTHMSVHNPAT